MVFKYFNCFWVVIVIYFFDKVWLLYVSEIDIIFINILFFGLLF